MAKSRFNPSLAMPVMDIVVAVLLIAATGFFWFRTKGEAKIEAALADLQAARQQNTAEIQVVRENLARSEQELIDIGNERDAKGQYAVFLEEQVGAERQNIIDARALEEEYTDTWLDLRSQVQRANLRRAAYRTDIFETEQKIDETSAVNADYVAQTTDRNDRLDRLDRWIREARGELERDPPSRFPERSALASVLEVADPGNSIIVSLTHDVTGFGKLRLGLLAGLGLGDGSDTSIKEGGLYANLPLMPRRASIDFEGGISQRISREDEEDDLGPFAGATFRLAPLRQERFFILAGTRYSHEDVGMRIGVGLGRR